MNTHTLIERPLYLKRLVQMKDLPLIKTITGVRRSGKSTLLNKIFFQHLVESGTREDHVIRINFESREFLKMQRDEIFEYVSSRIIDESPHYLLFDEIQEVEGFDRLVNALMVDLPVDIYLSGSNSKLLGKELSTYLSGRYVEIAMLPLSFSEYHAHVRDTMDEESILMTYLQSGGFPLTIGLDDEKRDIILDGIYHSVVMKDIVERYDIRDSNLLTNIVLTVYSAIGSMTSPAKLANTLTSKGYSASLVSVRNYLDYLCSSFILYKCRRYSIKGKAYLDNVAKYYAPDLGLRNSILHYRQGDVSRLLENAVFIELTSRGFSVDVGQCDAYEVDFICRKGADLFYLQVTTRLDPPEKLEQETRSLLRTGDAFDKYLVTMDRVLFPMLENGIKVRNIIDFLLNPFS